MKKPPPTKRPAVTLTEAARRLGIDTAAKNPERVVKNMVHRHELAGVKVGRFVMVDPDSIDDFIGGIAAGEPAPEPVAAPMTAEEEIEALGMALARVIARCLMAATKSKS